MPNTRNANCVRCGHDSQSMCGTGAGWGVLLVRNRWGFSVVRRGSKNIRVAPNVAWSRRLDRWSRAFPLELESVNRMILRKMKVQRHSPDDQDPIYGDVFNLPTTRYSWHGIHADVYDEHDRPDSCELLIVQLRSDSPGSGRLWMFMEELKHLTGRRLVFVNVVNRRLRAWLDRLGYVCITPGQAYKGDPRP